MITLLHEVALTVLKYVLSVFIIFLLSILMKEFVQPKMSLNNREFLIWKERERERERGEAGGSARNHIQG